MEYDIYAYIQWDTTFKTRREIKETDAFDYYANHTKKTHVLTSTNRHTGNWKLLTQQ